MVSINSSLGKSVFLEKFGDYPINRILDFLVVFNAFDYSIVDIAKNSGVGYSTLKILMKDLIKNKIVVQSRNVGKSKMFKLNNESIIVKRFIQFYWDITNNMELKKETQIKKIELTA
ncbi:MAG: hypothetical protein AABX61_01300 [Nanoarchaeota archaeon]